MHCALLFRGFRAAHTPAAQYGVLHSCSRKIMVVLVHVFGVEVGYHVCWFGRCEQRDTCAVAQEAEVAEVGNYVDGRVPGRGCGKSLAWACIVYGADVATIEADAGAALK